MGIFHEDLYTCMVVSGWIFLSEKTFRENENTKFIFNNDFPRKSCRLWNNVVKKGTARQTTDDSIIRRMRFACWITKTKDTHLEYVILMAFPWKLWLREGASVLRCTYIACLVFFFPFSDRIYESTNATIPTVEINVCVFALRLTTAWNQLSKNPVPAMASWSAWQ